MYIYVYYVRHLLKWVSSLEKSSHGMTWSDKPQGHRVSWSGIHLHVHMYAQRTNNDIRSKICVYFVHTHFIVHNYVHTCYPQIPSTSSPSLEMPLYVAASSILPSGRNRSEAYVCTSYDWNVSLCLKLLADVTALSNYILRTTRCNDAKSRLAARFVNLVLHEKVERKTYKPEMEKDSSPIPRF